VSLPRWRQPHHISQRQQDQDPRVIDIAWGAQRRLYKRWHLHEERRKKGTVVAVAVGRELAAYCWEISTLTG